MNERPEFVGFEMKVGYDAGRGLMKDYIFAGEAFRKVQYSGLCSMNIGDGFDPDGMAESICSQDVIRLYLHRYPGGESRLAKIANAVNQVNTCIERWCDVSGMLISHEGMYRMNLIVMGGLAMA